MVTHYWRPLNRGWTSTQQGYYKEDVRVTDNLIRLPLSYEFRFVTMEVWEILCNIFPSWTFRINVRSIKSFNNEAVYLAFNPEFFSSVR